jgi:hypothetical protein
MNKLFQLFKFLLIISFPWTVLFANDNPGGAILALILQVTLVGWPFAAYWALRVNEESKLSGKKDRGRENTENVQEERVDNYSAAPEAPVATQQAIIKPAPAKNSRAKHAKKSPAKHAKTAVKTESAVAPTKSKAVKQTSTKSKPRKTATKSTTKK